MKLIKYIIICVVYSLLVISNSNPIENKILFKVNNEIITSLDILMELKYLAAINKEFNTMKKKTKFEISKNSLIREKIREIEIKKNIKDIKIEDEILNNLILNYFKDLKINSIDEFESFFLNKNIDPNLIRKKISVELLWNQLIFGKYKKNVKIDEELIKNNLSDNKKQREFLILEILFNISENENLIEKTKLIKDSIKKIGFPQTALAYSISNTANKGGKLGWVAETILSEKIYIEFKTLTKEEYTKPILVQGGFLILRLLDFRETNKDFNIDKEVKKVVAQKTNQQLITFYGLFFNTLKKDIIINEL